MIVISLWQPWATLAVIGAKQNETRGRRTHHRGTLGIHATQSSPGWTREFCERPSVREAVQRFAPELVAEWGEMFPGGVLLGKADLVDCLSTNQTVLRDDGTLLPPPAGTFEDSVGDFSADRWMWVLKNPKRLAVPIRTRGGQFLWHSPEAF